MWAEEGGIGAHLLQKPTCFSSGLILSYLGTTSSGGCPLRAPGPPKHSLGCSILQQVFLGLWFLPQRRSLVSAL